MAPLFQATLPAADDQKKRYSINMIAYSINTPDAAWKLLTTDKLVTLGTAL